MPRLVKQTVLYFVLISPILLWYACHPGLTPADPKAAQALKADGVVIRVNEFQAALIQWCGPLPECTPASLDTYVFRDLLTLCIDLRRTLKAIPDGWQATVKAAWVGAKPKLDIIKGKNPTVALAIVAVDAVIGGL